MFTLTFKVDKISVKDILRRRGVHFKQKLNSDGNSETLFTKESTLITCKSYGPGLAYAIKLEISDSLLCKEFIYLMEFIKNSYEYIE